jgi:hypothetical protein
MSRPRRQPATRLTLNSLETREVPSVWVNETFDQTPVGALPNNWNQWSSGSNAYAVAASQANSAPNSLASNAASNVTARSWATVVTGADTSVSANVYTSSLSPTEVFARGQNLNSAAPTFYAASLTRGINVQLIKNVGGTRTVLGTVTSTAYTSFQWSKVTLRTTGNSIQVEVINTGTGQYLNAQGQWQTAQTFALSVTDSAITAGGQVGVNRPAAYAGTVNLDDFRAEAIGSSSPPTAPPTNTTTITQRFDQSPVGALPTGWQSYTTSGGTAAVQSGSTLSAPNQLVLSAPSGQTTRAWMSDAVGPNVEISAAVFLDTLHGAQIIGRGSNLNSAAPTFYAVEITRGLNLRVTKTINGQTTVLTEGASLDYVSFRWVTVTLRLQGSAISVFVRRADTNQFLTANGGWSVTAAAARTVTDSSITGNGVIGLGRTGPYAGSVKFDNFSAIVSGSTGDSVAPTVSITAPTNPNVSGTVTVSAQATDNVGVTRVEFWLNNQLQSTVTQAPYTWNFASANVANGSHALSVRAFDAAGNVGIANLTLNVQNEGGGVVQPPGGPVFPRHYDHIRVAQLAYFGTPITSFELGLLENSVDLVVPNTNFLSTINNVAPDTPQLIYGNFSNLYLDLLLDWLNYADDNNIDRETAFYHVAQATNFSGGSPSSQPVNWLWRVARNSTNLTGESRTGTVGDVALGSVVGDVVYFGYLEKFRELNFNITTPSGNGWSAVWEYPTAVDAAGNPTAWAAFTPVSNTTNNLKQSGRVTFDPPANWKKSVASGTTPLFFVRLRVTAAASAPVAATVLGRDYVNANGTTSGVMPAFDPNADLNGDGYLTDAEYALRASGKDARFRYESRLFYPAYGQMRFATNPAPTTVRVWVGDMLNRMFATFPLADGLFVDNSNGKSPAIGINTVESTVNYSAEYGQLMAVVGNAIAPRWLMANTTGGGAYTSHVVNNTPGVMEEFLLRPLAATWSRFLDVADVVNNWVSAPNAPYVVLDSHPQNGSPTDARTQIATLAYYYMLGDPVRTFLMFYGGFEPSSSWTRHWSPAAAYNVGQPQGSFTVWATGNDPANTALEYRVYRRNYGNAIVLYKPLSYKVAVGTGTIADNTATVHQLGGNYRSLKADGTLGPVITSISLRNGEGAILVPA